MTQTPTDALRLVPDDHLAALIQQADDGFGYSMEMVRLVDGVRTYRLKIEGQETVEITDGDDNDYDAQQACYRLINAAKNKVRADAVRTALAAAPASPLPGGGWQDISTAPKDGTDVLVAPHMAVVSWDFGAERWIVGVIPLNDDRTIADDWTVQPVMFFEQYLSNWGVEPTHWMALPAAPTGEPK